MSCAIVIDIRPVYSTGGITPLGRPGRHGRRDRVHRLDRAGELEPDRGLILPSMFGRGGHAVLPRQELLPSVMVEVVRRLLAA
jgi:hypothetical protein